MRALLLLLILFLASCSRHTEIAGQSAPLSAITFDSPGKLASPELPDLGPQSVTQTRAITSPVLIDIPAKSKKYAPQHTQKAQKLAIKDSREAKANYSGFPDKAEAQTADYFTRTPKKWVALLLCFVGFAGLPMFYYNYKRLGIIHLILLGLIIAIYLTFQFAGLQTSFAVAILLVLLWYALILIMLLSMLVEFILILTNVIVPKYEPLEDYR